MKTTKKPSARRILLVDQIVRLHDARDPYPDVFRASVATISEDDGLPRNWRRPSDERIKNDTGGFSLRAFKCDDGRVLWGFNGPKIESDNSSEYLEVANAITAMDRRLERLRDQIGNPSGELERMIRRIMALNIDSVWMRPENGERHPSNLTEGKWKTFTVGQFGDHLRDVFVHEPARLASAAESAA